MQHNQRAKAAEQFGVAAAAHPDDNVIQSMLKQAEEK